MAITKKSETDVSEEKVSPDTVETDADNVNYEQLKEENNAMKAQINTLFTMLGNTNQKSTAAEDVTETEEVKQAKIINKEMSEIVEKTYYSRNNNEKDIKVLVNGVCRIIKLGVPVRIPKYVAEVIENSYIQNDYVSKLIESKEKTLKESENEFLK